jgi:eukaryotic-like serine/threonine-protein kinase
MIGRVVSRYRIIEQLGHGGMGVVYKARDIRLERLVALKFLTAGVAENATARNRFMQEARAASALDHPNICTIYGIEDTDDGQMFIAMSCYEGENLRQRLERGSMSVKEAVSVAIQVAQGLAKAHDHGIVHRDVKPGNVMLTSDGGVKLLDFGLAQLGESVRTTQPGTSVGTPAYMSPEQIRGEQCDGRTDVWSLGVLLYEMLTDQLPFSTAPVHALLHAIMTSDPRPPSVLRQGIPPNLDGILALALEKDRDRRYQTARELAAHLRAEIDGSSVTRSGMRDSSVTQTSYSIPAGGFSASSPSVVRTGLSILVLPFTNLSSDPENEYFADGLTEELITDLGQVPGLLVVSRNSAFQFKGKPADVRRIGQEMRVSNVLEGSVRKAGDRLRITAQLVNVADGYQAWSQRFDRRMEDVFAIQDEIVSSIVSSLKAKLTAGVPEAVVHRRRPENLEAWNLYLKGRYYVNRQTPDSLIRAAELFEQAIAQDPSYASAWAGLAEYYIAVGFWGVMPAEEIWPKARSHAQRAVELDPDLAHAQTALGYVRIFCDWDWIEAGRNFQRAVELAPGDSQAAYAHGLYLTQMSRTDEALAEFRRALRLDPLAMNVNTGLALVYFYRREYDKAIAQGLKTLEMDAAYFEMRAVMGTIYLQTTRFDEGLKYLEAVRRESGDNPLILGLLGYGYGVTGRDDEARTILARLEELAATQYVAPISRALACIGLGDHDAAFEWLDKAATAHDSLMCYLDVMPCYDPLRHDERFPALRRRMGLAVPESKAEA